MKKLLLSFRLFVFLLIPGVAPAQWIAQNPGTTNYIYSVFFTNANTGWITGSSATIRKTTNGGMNWFSQTTTLPFGAFQGLYFLDNFSGWIVGDQVYDSTIILRTVNGGTNWTLQNTGGGKILYSCFFINPQTGWAVGMSNTTYSAYIMYTSTGGANWSVQMNGGAGRLFSCYFLMTGQGWAGGVNSFVHTSNGGLSWDTITSAYTVNGLHFIDAQTGYMAENTGRVMKTTNGGYNWFVSFQGGFGTIKAVKFTDAATGWACGVQGKILKTTNGGGTWYLQNTPTGQDFNSLSFVTPTIGYATGSGGIVTKTTNGGEAPSSTVTIHRYNINKPIGPSQFTNDTVNFNSYFTNGGYARYVKVTLDTITNAINSNLEIFLIHQNKTDTIVYRVGGTGNNFYNTVLNDSALVPIENGIPPYNGQYRPSRPLSQFINLTTNGLWILKIYDIAKNLTGVIKSWSITITYTPSVGINKIENTVPDKFLLYQNYPNPFNPSTMIRFVIPGNSFVNLKVFDMLGREVAVLINENLNEGIYETPFNAPANLSSGIYFYKITAGDFSEVKRMVFLK
ncbi:MAG: T9SS type A sorting domain-containing protein [Ignavibacteriae bacterium]|nr:T9SS type A sorting domain-containing protein [Ignavibacteriota bacterium]